MSFTLYPPSETQLALIARLCDERGLEPPEVVASSQEASEIIGRIIRREYRPEDYLYPFRVGTGFTVLIGEPRETDADLHAVRFPGLGFHSIWRPVLSRPRVSRGAADRPCCWDTTERATDRGWGCRSTATRHHRLRSRG